MPKTSRDWRSAEPGAPMASPTASEITTCSRPSGRTSACVVVEEACVVVSVPLTVGWNRSSGG